MLISVNLPKWKPGHLRKLSNRFPPSERARKVAANAVKSRCARLAGGIGRDEVAVLCNGSNRIDALNRDEYFRDSHKNLGISKRALLLACQNAPSGALAKPLLRDPDIHPMVLGDAATCFLDNRAKLFGMLTHVGKQAVFFCFSAFTAQLSSGSLRWK